MLGVNSVQIEGPGCPWKSNGLSQNWCDCPKLGRQQGMTASIEDDQEKPEKDHKRYKCRRNYEGGASKYRRASVCAQVRRNCEILCTSFQNRDSRVPKNGKRQLGFFVESGI